MNFTLSKSILAGHKIKTSLGWRKVKSVGEEGVIVKEGLITFGATIYGWKSN